MKQRSPDPRSSLAVYALHQDVWFWRAARPLVFGFLPVGLVYHAAYSVAAALLLWLLVARPGPPASRRRPRAARRRRAPTLIPALIVFLYLGGRRLHRRLRLPARPAARRRSRTTSWPAARSGPFVFLMSLFGTNMTAFAILGSSGHAFHNGIVTYGLMASSSGLVIPLSPLPDRHPASGRSARSYGFITPVQLFRDRWEC